MDQQSHPLDIESFEIHAPIFDAQMYSYIFMTPYSKGERRKEDVEVGYTSFMDLILLLTMTNLLFL